MSITPKIRRLFTQVFDNPSLDAFCQDYFSAVDDRFSRGMQKGEKITILLDHCRRIANGFEVLRQAAYNLYEVNGLQSDELKDLADEIGNLIDEQSMGTTDWVTTTPPPTQSSDFKQIKLRALEKRLQTLIKQYEATNQQLNGILAAADKVAIEQQIKNFEQEIQIIESEINQFKR